MGWDPDGVKYRAPYGGFPMAKLLAMTGLEPAQYATGLEPAMFRSDV